MAEKEPFVWIIGSRKTLESEKSEYIAEHPKLKFRIRPMTKTHLEYFKNNPDFKKYLKDEKVTENEICELVSVRR